MTDPGLSSRLRQQSRRAGLMVGVSMALAIAICIGGFVVIYAGLTPWLSDFVPIDPPPATQAATSNVAMNAPVDQSDNNAEPEPEEPAPAEPTPTPEPESEPTPTPEPDSFEPTHQIAAPGESINLRPEPSTNNQPIRALSPATALQYLNEQTPGDDGVVWMRFATQEGEEGWVREIDTEPYEP